jgi:hypothetical protein
MDKDYGNLVLGLSVKESIELKESETNRLIAQLDFVGYGRKRIAIRALHGISITRRPRLNSEVKNWGCVTWKNRTK